MSQSDTEHSDIFYIGKEPLVAWGEEEDGSPRFSIMMANWRFLCPRGQRIHLGPDALFSATPLDDNGLSLVPSDELPDIEHGLIRIADFTLDQLRAKYLAHGEGWVSWRARVRWWLGDKNWHVLTPLMHCVAAMLYPRKARS